MLGGNLGSLSYGDVSVMSNEVSSQRTQYCIPGEICDLELEHTFQYNLAPPVLDQVESTKYYITCTVMSRIRGCLPEIHV